MGLGSTIGEVAGGIGGMALVLPPQVGAAVGGAIGGIGDSIAAKAKKKKAEGMLPETVDPMEANRYNDLKLREKQLMTGTVFQTALGENRKAQAATIAGVNQVSGGAGGAAIAAMLRADAAAGRTNNETLGKGLEQNNFLSQEMSALATRIAQRKFALQKQKYQQGMYDATAAQGEANSDLKAQAARTNYQPIIDMFSKSGSNTSQNPLAGAAAQVANSVFNTQAQISNNPFVAAPPTQVNQYAQNPFTAGFYSPTSNAFQNPFVAAPAHPDPSTFKTVFGLGGTVYDTPDSLNTDVFRNSGGLGMDYYLSKYKR